MNQTDHSEESKPDFINEPGTWEADLMFVNTDSAKQIYFVMINVNTRYLIVEPLGRKSTTEISYALCNILDNYGVEVNTIKVDGERGFKINEDIVYVYFNKSPRLLVPNLYAECYTNDNEFFTMKSLPNVKRNTYTVPGKTIYYNIVSEHDVESLKVYLHNIEDYKTKDREKYANDPEAIDLDDIIDYKMCDIKVVVNSSKFTLSHKIVDRVINTIRNAFGNNNSRMLDYNQMRQMVYYYNNTPHRSLVIPNYEANWYDNEEYKGSGLVKPPKYIYLTAAQMHSNRDLEWRYIRMMRSKLQTINKSLMTYRKGNIILVHLDYGKTIQKFQKQRRVFNAIALFLTYRGGNVACQILNKEYTKKNPYDLVPIIYTKFVANSYIELNNEYKTYFGC